MEPIDISMNKMLFNACTESRRALERMGYGQTYVRFQHDVESEIHWAVTSPVRTFLLDNVLDRVIDLMLELRTE